MPDSHVAGVHAGVDGSCQHELMVSGSDITPDREAEIARIIEAVTIWTHTRPDIRGVVVVGSWARGTATMSSDIDIVLLTNDPATYIVSNGWWGFLGQAELIATKQWGPLTERRVALASGLEIEFGIVPPSWASIDPPDPGTMGVVRDGVQLIYDPDGLLGALVGTAAE